MRSCGPGGLDRQRGTLDLRLQCDALLLFPFYLFPAAIELTSAAGVGGPGGTVDHVVNDVGAATNASMTPVNVVSYP